jgi:hypothetical protein
MPDLARFCRRLAAVVSLTLLAVAGTAVAAQAEGYGEIEAARFGSPGAGEGQFETQEAAGFGVDPTNNDVYVVDLPETGKIKPGGTGKEKFKPNEFLIQRFDPNSKGEYVNSKNEPGKPVAFMTFKPKDQALGEDEEIDEVTNIAVDPVSHRIYVLTSEQRPQGINGVTMAASQLWAFNIEGEQLTSLGVIAGTKVFTPRATGLGESLNNPEGIAVDPTNHEVIVLGEEEKGEGRSVTALERINTEKGTLVEKRWSDPTSEPEEPEGLLEDEASSPVVTKSGEVLVVHPGEIDEVDKIPASFASEAAPTPVFEANPEFEGEPAPVLEQLTSFPGTADLEPRGGGALSLGQEGTLYASAAITEQHPEKHHGELDGPLAPGVLELSSKGGEKEWADEGWTGGQSIATVGLTGACKVSINVYSQVAAGSGHHVFVFDENPEGPKIVEFGPEGKGCPEGAVTAPTASTLSSGGKLIGEEEEIPIKDAVTLSSNLVDSNALSVEWEFGDGTTQTVTTDEHQKTTVEHTFVKAGKLEIRERIHTDDLAKPVLETPARTIIIKGVGTGGAKPVVVSELATGVTRAAATLSGTVNPEGAAVTECEFEYGTTTGYGSTVHCSSSPGSGTNPVAVSAPIAGLSAGTTYHYRIVAGNASGKSDGSDRELKTETAPPSSPPSEITTTTTSTTPPPAKEGVLNFKAISPTVTVSGSSASVASTGAFTLKLQCAAGASSCSGTITLKTVKAVLAGKGKKKAILTLATGSFTLGGGQLKSLTLHLSATARSMLARSHVLSALATLVARNATAETATTKASVSLRPAKVVKKH